MRTLKSLSFEYFRKIFSSLRPFLIKETQTKAFSELRKRSGKLKAIEAVAHIKNEYFKRIEALRQENGELYSIFTPEVIRKMKADFDAYVDFNKLPIEIEVANGGSDISIVEAAAEEANAASAEQLSEAELECENRADQMMDLPSIRFTPKEPDPWKGDYSLLFKGKPLLTMLDTPLYFSFNFDSVSVERAENGLVQKPAYQILIHENEEGHCKLALLDLHDARVVLKRMLDGPSLAEAGENYYLISGNQLLASDGTRQKLKVSKENRLSLSILQKLFSAAPKITRVEWDHLRTFTNEKLQEFLRVAKELQGKWPHLSSFIGSCPRTVQ